jgi:anti-sigma factor RsiW
MHLDELLIGDYVDEALDAARRAEVDRHLTACAECRQLVADLAEIRQVAGSLDLREPPSRAWSRVERAIELDEKHVKMRRGGFSGTWGIRLAAAAAVVLATIVGVRYAARPSSSVATTAHSASSQPTAATSSAGAMSADAVEAELRAAESHYDKAIKGLEQIANSEQNALDPKTAATLQKNLAVIDQAINESRAAVRAQPTSEPAVSSLMDNFKTKLALLQDTVALINEMRKGNEPGTARIVSGLKQKGN